MTNASIDRCSWDPRQTVRRLERLPRLGLDSVHQRRGPLDCVRISNSTTTSSSRLTNPSHEDQAGAPVPEDARVGVKPKPRPSGDCAWAKFSGTVQVTTGPWAAPNPSSSARAIKTTSPLRLAGTRHEYAQLPPQPNSNWPRPTCASACRIANCGGASSL